MDSTYLKETIDQTIESDDDDEYCARSMECWTKNFITNMIFDQRPRPYNPVRKAGKNTSSVINHPIPYVSS